MQIFMVPKRLSFICFSQMASSCCSMGMLSLWRMAPATLQRMSIFPNSSITLFTMVSTSAGLVISAFRAMLLIPRSLIAPAVISTSSITISDTATASHPSFASSSAVFFPKPTWLPAPVTNATLPLKPRSITASYRLLVDIKTKPHSPEKKAGFNLISSIHKHPKVKGFTELILIFNNCFNTLLLNINQVV